MIRVIRVRYKYGVWFSYPVDQKFNTLELAKEHFQKLYSTDKILLDYEER